MSQVGQISQSLKQSDTTEVTCHSCTRRNFSEAQGLSFPRLEGESTWISQTTLFKILQMQASDQRKKDFLQDCLTLFVTLTDSISLQNFRISLFSDWAETFNSYSSVIPNLLLLFLSHRLPAHCFCCCCLVAKSCLILCSPTNCGPSGFSVRGVSQARIPEWVTISFSSESFPPMDQTHVSSSGRQIVP